METCVVRAEDWGTAKEEFDEATVMLRVEMWGVETASTPS